MSLINEIDALEGFNVLKRTLTAIALIVGFGIAFKLGSEALRNVVIALIAISSYEMYMVVNKRWPVIFMGSFLVILSFLFIDALKVVPIASLGLMMLLLYVLLNDDIRFEDLSFVVLVTMILSLGVFAISNILKLDLSVLGYVIVATYATDTFAYLGGNLFGKHKLIERISPNKTVEGAIAGTVGSIVLSILFAYFFVNLEFTVVLYASLLIPIFAQVGDLTFSMIKRKFDIKDFGNIFPGHGGVLDRIDSVLFSLIIFNIILSLV